MKPVKLGNEEVMHLDRISHLPDDLLLRILSLVPVRIAMSTSLLSKRWNYVWKMMPKLVYDETCRYNGSLGFDQFCRKSLPLHGAPVLKTLNIKLINCSDSIDNHLFQNICSTLLEITITLKYCHNGFPIRFPNNLNVFKTLLVLKLKGRTVLDVVDSPVGFPFLKTLHLTYVRFERKESFKIILSVCPVLEGLILEALCTAGHYLSPISLSSPSLQRLSIDTKYEYYRDKDPILEISAPFLKYLKICDIRACYNLIEDMPKLVEANVSVDLPRHEHLFKFLSSLERLSISLHAGMVVDLTDGLIFNRLLHLELDINYAFCSNLLLRFLRHFPNIQSLKLLQTYLTYRRGQLNCLVSVPKCLSFHLEILQWKCYGNERETVVYIFKNAPHLKTATFSLRSKDMGDVMMKDLRSMPKASASCQLVFKKDF